ncbi:acyl-coenzyme A diphosphatase NUDT19-like [Centruroides vittatus]|uniref:acyl-coenzyme A diphosphatase NUDT19-like n=1 Tax=Centruroides vittatus TaxID=120091 RepID=UPI00350FCABF
MEKIPPWKEAATLIIAARVTLKELVGVSLANALSSSKSTTGQSRCDYRLLMVKRSNLSSFMANAFVFPGGKAEIKDFSPNWWEVFSRQGITKHDIEKFCSKVTGPRPDMIIKSSTLKYSNVKNTENYLPPDVALRISAIRETFEETGISILTRSSIRSDDDSSSILDGIDIKGWRDKIRKDPLSFVDFCLEANVCPDIWTLHEWWDWLTPTSVGHKRYDTMFYICCLDKQPSVILDQSEVITYRWGTPEEFLEEHCVNAAFLAPPQVYELSRLIHFKNYQMLQKFVRYRSVKGVERWLPVLCSCKDGALSLLPGDDMYPKKPDYIGKAPGKDLPKTVEEVRQSCQQLHRMEICGPSCTTYSNIVPQCSHLQPKTYRPSQPIVQSFL